MKKLHAIIISFLLGMTLVLPVAAPASAQVDARGQICEGIGLTGGGDGCRVQQGERSITSVVRAVINIFSLVVGVAAVFVIIFAGLRYIIAAGDASKISSAKDTIIYALVGLVVVALAQVIVRFVVGRTT